MHTSFPLSLPLYVPPLSLLSLLSSLSPLSPLLSLSSLSSPLSLLSLLSSLSPLSPLFLQEEADNKKKEKDRERRLQRKRRESFQSLLEELHEAGRLNSTSFWKTLYPSFSNDHRYLDMLGQPGKTLLLTVLYVQDQLQRYKILQLHEQFKRNFWCVKWHSWSGSDQLRNGTLLEHSYGHFCR